MVVRVVMEPHLLLQALVLLGLAVVVERVKTQAAQAAQAVVVMGLDAYPQP
jgi:hypothetical protein